MSWERLIRFLDESGEERFGDPCLQDAEELQALCHRDELFAMEYQGDSPFSLTETGLKVKVKRVLGILNPSDVPIIKCVGLNYMKHIQEAGRKPPPFPSIFIKPRTSIANHEEDIPIPSLAQDDQCDYEGELSMIIGKTGKNIPKAEALDYVAGYVASNDVSARKWQRDPAYAGGVPQWGFSKGFDKYAPLSPMIVSPKVIHNASGLRLQTFVNGEVRQDTRTDDLIFGVEDIIAFVSQGTTLEKGTVIMTGTPSGVALGMNPPKWVKDGDVVEVKIEKVGRVRNKMVFE